MLVRIVHGHGHRAITGWVSDREGGGRPTLVPHGVATHGLVATTDPREQHAWGMIGAPPRSRSVSLAAAGHDDVAPYAGGTGSYALDYDSASNTTRAHLIV